MTSMSLHSIKYHESAVLPPLWDTQPYAVRTEGLHLGADWSFWELYAATDLFGLSAATQCDVFRSAEPWGSLFEAAQCAASYQFKWAVDEIRGVAVSRAVYIVVKKVHSRPVESSEEAYFELMPEGWTNDYAARHRARLAQRMEQDRDSADVDMPLIFDGADW